MNRLAVLPRLTRGFASAAPKTSTGIEHADAHKKAGGGNPDWKAYKVGEYLNMNTYSYYDVEVTMGPSRVTQPSNKRPDVMPKVKA